MKKLVHKIIQSLGWWLINLAEKIEATEHAKRFLQEEESRDYSAISPELLEQAKGKLYIKWLKQNGFNAQRSL